MRAPFALALSLTAICVQAQKATFNAMQDGKNIGSLTIVRKVTGSTMSVTVTMDIQEGQGRSAKIAVVTVYDGKGMPKSKMATISSGGNTAKLSSTFSASGAKVTTVNQGKTQIRDLKAPGKSSLADIGTWWFVPGRPKPKVNATYTYQSLSPLNLQWTESTSQYLGLASVTIAGKSIKAHKVATARSNNEKSTAWLDDKGMPWMLDQGKVKFIRR